MGACVTGDTLITLLDGTCQTIKQIVEEQKIKQIPCIDINTHKQVIGNISQYCDIGLRPTLEITLASGKKLCGTYEHPIICRTGNSKQYYYNWTRLDQVHVGDLVATKLTNDIYGNISESYARIIGMLIADGCYSHNMVQYATKDLELEQYIYKLFPNGVSSRIQYLTKDNKPFKSFYIHNFQVELKRLGIFQQTGINKALPIDYLSWDKTSLQELVGGLFDTDGCIHKQKSGKYYKYTIEYSTISEQLCDQIINVLLKFGIHVNKYTRASEIHTFKNSYQSTTKPLYKLVITGQYNLIKFANNFKLLVQYKQNVLCDILNFYKGKALGSKRYIAGDDIYFEAITNIRDTSQQYVYDLTVDHYHSFISNDIISHNTNAKLIKIGKYFAG